MPLTVNAHFKLNNHILTKNKWKYYLSHSSNPLAFIIVVQLYAMNEQRSIETYPYVVNKKYDTFETVATEASLFTCQTLYEFKRRPVKGSILAGYIFWRKWKERKISMTTCRHVSRRFHGYVFWFPKKFNKETLPQPSESQIEFRNEPAKLSQQLYLWRLGKWNENRKVWNWRPMPRKSTLTNFTI
jgi:hypothetical protein